MRDEFRRLPGEEEIGPRLLSPTLDCSLSRRAVEHAVEFGSLELAGIILKLRLDRQALRIKRTSPRLVMPAGSADQDAFHCSGFHDDLDAAILLSAEGLVKF